MPQRVYIKAEVLLIVKAHKLWWKEFYNDVQAIGRPSMFRFGQIYWDMRRYFLSSAIIPDEYELNLPKDYRAPSKLKFDPNKVYFREGQTYLRCIYLTNCAIRDSDELIRREIKRKTRFEFLSKVFGSRTKEQMESIIEEYEEIVYNAASN